MPAGALWISGLALGAVYALAGVALLLLYRSTGVLNLAQGALGALAALLAWQLAAPGPVGLPAAAVAVGAATAVALLYGHAVAPRLAAREPVLQALGTVGLALALLGAVGWAWPPAPRRLLLPTDALVLQWPGLRLTGSRLLALAVAVLAAGGTGWLLACSRLGLAWRALADHRAHARLLGVPVERAEHLAWAWSGLLCGIAGLLLGHLVRLDAGTLTFLVVPALAAAVVGRLHAWPATLAAGLAIGVAEAWATQWPAASPFRAAVPFALALLVEVARALAAVRWRGWRRPRRRALTGPLPKVPVAPAADAAAGRWSVAWPAAGPTVRRLLGPALAIALLPVLLGGYWLQVWTAAVIYAMAACGVALLQAQLGLVQLAQVAWMGVGGWLCLRLWHGTGWPVGMCLGGATLGTALAGALVGLPLLRLRGLGFALASLMLAGAFGVLIHALQFPNGGSDGLAGYGPGMVPMARPTAWTGDAALLRGAALLLWACLALQGAMVRGAPGRAWALMRENPAAALACAVPVNLRRLQALAWCAATAGLAGSLLALQLGTLDPRSFAPGESIVLLATTVIAGPQAAAGPLLAGVLHRVVPGALASLGLDAQLALLLFGLALMHALATAPQGLVVQLQTLARMAWRFRWPRRAPRPPVRGRP